MSLLHIRGHRLGSDSQFTHLKRSSTHPVSTEAQRKWEATGRILYRWREQAAVCVACIVSCLSSFLGRALVCKMKKRWQQWRSVSCYLNPHWKQGVIVLSISHLFCAGLGLGRFPLGGRCEKMASFHGGVVAAAVPCAPSISQIGEGAIQQCRHLVVLLTLPHPRRGDYGLSIQAHPKLHGIPRSLVH